MKVSEPGPNQIYHDIALGFQAAGQALKTDDLFGAIEMAVAEREKAWGSVSADERALFTIIITSAYQLARSAVEAAQSNSKR